MSVALVFWNITRMTGLLTNHYSKDITVTTEGTHLVAQHLQVPENKFSVTNISYMTKTVQI